MKITTVFGIIGIFILASVLGCQLYAGAPGIDPAKCQTTATRLFANNTINIFDQMNVTMSDIIAGSSAAFIVASVVFPNPFTLFAPIAFLLLSYTILPSDVFYFFGIPDPIGTFLTNIMIFFMGITVLGWFKGTES